MLRDAYSRKAFKKLIRLSPAFLLLAGFGTGCAMPVSPLTAAGSNATSYSSVSDTSGTDSTVPTTVGASTGTNSPYQFNIQGNGYDSHTVTVSAGTVLKVRFIAGKQNQETNGQFYQYSMLGVYVGVGADLQPTGMISNGYGGYQAAESAVIDLSQFVGSNCSTSNPACRQNVIITVNQPHDDDACINQGYTYCPNSQVPGGHPWNGTLVVQTDDTIAI